MESSEVVSNELDFSRKILNSSEYHYRRINSDQGATVGVELGSLTSVDYTIPTECFNFEPSIFELGFQLPAQGANTYVRAHTDGKLAPIDSIVLSDNDGLELARIFNVPYYTKTVQRATTPLNEFLTYAKNQSVTTETAWTALKEGARGFHKTDLPSFAPDVAVSTTETAQRAIYSGLSENKGANDDAGTTIADATNITGAIYRAKVAPLIQAVISAETTAKLAKKLREGHYNQCSVNNGAVADTKEATEPYMHVAKCCGVGTADKYLDVLMHIPLAMFKHTILSLNKTLYFGKNLRLTINFNYGSKWGYRYTGATRESLMDGVSGDLTVKPTIHVMALHLAVEKNPALRAEIMGQFASPEGLQLTIPWVNDFSYTHVSAGENSLIRKLNSRNGRRLLRVYVAPFGTSSVGINYCNNYNESDAQLTTFQSSINNQPLQTYVLDLSKNEDWWYMSQKLEGSVYTGCRPWKQNWVWVDDFCNIARSVDFPKYDSVDSGLDLLDEKDYSVVCNTAAAGLNMRVFAITQKHMQASSAGLRVD